MAGTSKGAESQRKARANHQGPLPSEPWRRSHIRKSHKGLSLVTGLPNGERVGNLNGHTGTRSCWAGGWRSPVEGCVIRGFPIGPGTRLDRLETKGPIESGRQARCPYQTMLRRDLHLKGPSPGKLESHTGTHPSH